MGVRPTAEGFDLLIEALDAHQTAPGVSGPPYDPNTSVQEYYHPNPLAANDGYENQLAFYMDGPGQTTIQSWGENMYGY